MSDRSTPKRPRYDSQILHDNGRNKTRISIGNAIGKWRQLKADKNLSSDAKLANFLIDKEKELSSKVIIHMKGNATSIDKPTAVRGEKLKDRAKTFFYDFSYDSTDKESPTFASQERVFHDLGTDVLKAAFGGYNACVFAYGQTGSGKSHTMMGHSEDKGLIPRICEGLFSEISQKRSASDAVSFRTEVSYLEIYNERVQDLLRKRPASSEGAGLRVREHPRDGPYVESLSKHLVHDHSELEGLIHLGNVHRTTASTGMNSFSSRSHAIFTVSFTQACFDGELPCETLSKIHLVDLAGSERAEATRTTGARLKEGANINKSLVTLGNVISALADLSAVGESTKKKNVFVPYRDSVLTWLLKDSLGGNSVTTMIATLSPADVNYAETLNTMRYASRAKSIVNTPTVNEDGNVKLIRDLKAEVDRLRTLLQEARQVSCGMLSPCVRAEEQLHHNEEKVLALTEEWCCKWGETRSILQEKTVALRKEGSGVVLDCDLPHLIAIDEDLLSTGLILYYVKEGRTLIGSDVSYIRGIVLRGPGILREHCVLENCGGTVTLVPQDGALCSVNGCVVTHPCQLTQGAITQLGKGTMLRFNNPTEAAQLREKQQDGLLSPYSLSLTDTAKSTDSLSKVMLQSPGRMNTRDAERDESKVLNRCLSPATTRTFKTTAIAGRYRVPHTCLESSGDTLHGGISTGDGQEQERDSCHKSGPRLVSEQPPRAAQSGAAAAASYRGERVRSGDVSLQQTGVLGPGDGCGTEPEGNANEMRDVVADCCEGMPVSAGSSLGATSHLLSGSTSVLPRPQPREKPLSGPTEESASEGRQGCGGTDESEGSQEMAMGECAAETEAAQNSRLGSLVSKVSWIVQDAGRLLWSCPNVLQQVRKEGLQPVGAHCLSVVKDSQVFSMVKGSFVFSLVKDSHIFSVVKELPLIQRIQMEINRNLRPKTTAPIIPDGTELPVLTPSPTYSSAKALIAGDLWLNQEQAASDTIVKPKHKLITECWPPKPVREPKGPPATGKKAKTLVNSRTAQNQTNVKVFRQTLIKFPDSLWNLQSLPLRDVLDKIHTLVTSQKIAALFWLNVAKSGQHDPRPALLILAESGLFTLTADSGPVVLFHQLPLLQLREVHITLGGHGLRLTGSTEESLLGVYTYSQKLTQELCRAVLGVMCPGDNRVSEHPLLHGDLAEMSLDWEARVPDLLLDVGLRVRCCFQKSLAGLVYLLHSNMAQGVVALGDVQLLLYTSVRAGVVGSSSHSSESLAQLFLTDTHLGLVQEDAVFHPTLAPSRMQFHDVTLRPRSAVRCVLVHDEDAQGTVTLDVILARGKGHPETVAKATTTTTRPGPYSSNSPPRPEVWKLTFGCSSEAVRLINHLSDA